MLIQSLVFLSSLLALAQSVPVHNTSTSLSKDTKSAAASCFPAVGFKMPNGVPDSLDGWWCNMNDEYAFVGFSYEISACKFPYPFTHS